MATMITNTFVFMLIFLIVRTLGFNVTVSPIKIEPLPEIIIRPMRLQHRETLLFVGKYQGTDGERVRLVKSKSEAESFKLVDKNGYPAPIVTTSGKALLDKQFGCYSIINDIAYRSQYFDLRQQKYVITNEGIIRSDCCSTCILGPNQDNSGLEMKDITSFKTGSFAFNIIKLPIDIHKKRKHELNITINVD